MTFLLPFPAPAPCPPGPPVPGAPLPDAEASIAAFSCCFNATFTVSTRTPDAIAGELAIYRSESGGSGWGGFGTRARVGLGFATGVWSALPVVAGLDDLEDILAFEEVVGAGMEASDGRIVED